jgi:[histone H3]-lysine36 N-dimethyltransferase SETMAR
MSDRQIKYRSVIEFLMLEGQSATQIHERMLNVYDEASPSLSTIYNWINDFKRGRTSVASIPSTGRPKTVSTADILQKLEEIVMQDRRLKVSEIAERMDIPKTTIHRMLTDDLNMRKLSARWVPKLLTPSQKQDRVDISNENLDLMEQDWDLLSTLVTGDETWVYYYDPETKQQYMQWKHHRRRLKSKNQLRN